MKPSTDSERDWVAFAVSSAVWVPLLAAIIRAPFWITRLVNDGGSGQRLQVRELPEAAPAMGPCLFMDANLKEPINGDLILKRVRLICASSAILASSTAAVALVCWLALGRPWLFAIACVFVAVLAWEVYPRDGIRFRSFLVMRRSILLDLCMVAFGRGLQERVPIRDWHSSYFEILRDEAYELDQEPKALVWLYLRAMCKGNFDAAGSFMERRLSLPIEGAAEQYVVLGTALHFYTAVAPDSVRSRFLARQIRAIEFPLPVRIEYIEASLALADTRYDEALSITQTELDEIGMNGDIARVQLQREMLLACRQCVLGRVSAREMDGVGAFEESA